MTPAQRFYYIEEMSAILGKTPAAIHGHLARKQYDAVPPPVKIGRRQAWLVEAVEEWINAKVIVARVEVEKQMEFMRVNPVKRGRPTKTEEIKRRKEQQDLEVLKRLGQSLEGEGYMDNE